MQSQLRLGLWAAGLWMFSQSAAAHISLDLANTHKSRYGFEMKQGPCGRTNGTRGTNIYTYEPGSTIHVAVSEFVPHPGYFRISFDQNGDGDFMNPRTIAPLGRQCLDDPADKCGASDFYNNKTVLMDDLNPHLGSDGPRTREWDVKLPNVECDNCTLQIIQVMMDQVHAPYSPSYTADSTYYQCIDLVLKKAT